jgi:guanylate kinase
VLIVVTGPSGCGKTTILRHVFKDLRNVSFSVSHTTRPPRPSERDGRDYHFVTAEVFARMIGRGRFLEWAVVHGHCYGTSKAEVARKSRSGDLLLDIDVQGARQIRERCAAAVFVFILPPVYRELRRRLRERGEDSAEAVERRLRDARREIRRWRDFDYVVINDRLDRAVLELESIILSSRCRATARKTEIQAVLESFPKRRVTSARPPAGNEGF